MNAKLMDFWLGAVLVTALARPAMPRRVVVVLDDAKLHGAACVREEAKRCGIELFFVPGGCTPYVQPLDRTPFRFLSCAHSGTIGSAASGGGGGGGGVAGGSGSQSAGAEGVARLAVAMADAGGAIAALVWKELPMNTITDSFSRCGLTGATKLLVPTTPATRAPPSVPVAAPPLLPLPRVLEDKRTARRRRPPDVPRAQLPPVTAQRRAGAASSESLADGKGKSKKKQKTDEEGDPSFSPPRELRASTMRARVSPAAAAASAVIDSNDGRIPEMQDQIACIMAALGLK